MARKALGRGLSSLIPQAPARKKLEPTPLAPTEPTHAGGIAEGVQQIDLDRIRPNREQPRKDFDESALEELAQSLRNQGVIQPIVVRAAAGGSYELIVGERRWRAAQHAGLLKIPAIVRDVADDKLLELALIENLQREELNPMETAVGIQNLIDHLGLTQADVADRVGKQRSTVTNLLRLLHLPSAVQQRIRSGEVSLGHAKALASLSSPRLQVDLADKIARESISVRQAEEIVARTQRPGQPPARKRVSRDPNVAAAESNLQTALGTKVSIVQGPKGKGHIEVHFGSDEELQRLYDTIVAGTQRTDGR